METKFNFNSQVCTDKNQSERLLSLGLKKETADIRGVEGIEHTPTYAWSLHRLIEMIQTMFLRVNLCGWWVHIERRAYDEEYCADAHNNLYDNIVDCIEWLIKEGYFPKEYLV